MDGLAGDRARIGLHLRIQCPILHGKPLPVGAPIDSERRLIGTTSLRDILVATSDSKIEDIMHRNVISVYVDDDKEEVAKKLSDYDFLAISVVDHDNRLVGIVTVDDVVDVVQLTLGCRFFLER